MEKNHTIESRKRELRYHNDLSPETMQHIVNDVIKAATAVPVDIQIDAQHRVLSFDRVREHLLRADRITLLDCNCRLNRPNCDAPLHVCLAINATAERMLAWEQAKPRNPHNAGIDEAVHALEISHKAGLVHMAYTVGESDRVTAVCSCCTCCCGPLSTIVRYGLGRHLLTPGPKPHTEVTACTSCGICVDRCQFGARNVVEGVLEVTEDYCVGCGLCVAACPEGCTRLVEDEDTL